MRRHLLTLAALATLTAACGGDDNVGSDAAFATDKWSQPTHNGVLDFDDENVAKFTDSTRFHGWSFEVTGDVDVTIRTDSKTANLNPVLYLYEATEDGIKTGGYLKKNDNASSETMEAEITRSLSPGHYFVQVKTTHILQRGTFALDASCSGVGCPVKEAPSAEDYCASAEESFGKCMDDSLDATEEECAPRGADAMLCCNQVDEWYCSDVCDPGNFDLATVWGEDLDDLYETVPEDDYSGLMNWTSMAFASCGNPSLDDISKEVLDVVGQIDDGQGPWTIGGWTTPNDAGFHTWFANEDVMTVAGSLLGEEVAAHFEAWADIPCPNCTDGIVVDALYFPQVGKVVILESRAGGDS